MIVGIGVDLVDLRRMERVLRVEPWQSMQDVFTAREIAGSGTGRRRAVRLSACFAAKEAALKALGAKVEDLGMFREVELLHGPGGKQTIVLHSRAQSQAKELGVAHIWVSIASAKETAGAFVVMES